MVMLDKTPESIRYGNLRSLVNRELRKNSLAALAVEFGERARRASYKAEVLAK